MKPLYRVELVEKDNQHFYTIDDNPTYLPGVTGILSHISKPFLQQWAAKESAIYCTKILKKIELASRFPSARFYETMVKRAKKQHHFIKNKAAEIGSHAHEIFDDHLKNKTPLGAGQPFNESFNYFLKKNKLKIVQGDTKIASLKYQYGGSLDVIFEENGKLIIGDFKTGKSIYDTHAYQVASYSYAMQETYGLDYLPEGYIVRFEKEKPQYEMRKIQSIDNSFKAFKAALDLYRAENFDHFQYRETVKEKKTKKEKTK